MSWKTRATALALESWEAVREVLAVQGRLDLENSQEYFGESCHCIGAAMR